MKRLLEEFLDNLRFGARTLWNAKVFTTIAVVCLALGIGGTTAIFSVVKTVLLDPLPYPEPQRLVAVEFGPSPRSWSWSMPLVDLLAEQQTSFESVGGFRPMQYNVSTTGEAVQVSGAQVTPGFLDALAIDPVVGLSFTQQDDRTTADPVAMISYEFSERVFDHPTAALGEPLWVDGSAYTVVGVLPPGFGEIWDHADVLLPPGRLRDSFPLNHFGAQRFTVVGRLAPESTVASAEAQLSGLPTQIIERWPQIGQTGGFTIELKPLDETMVGDSKDTLWLLMAAVVSALLIAAANVANLLLARANVRVRETAIRQALGASASSMVRQHLTEGLLLGLIGGAAGLVVASWGVELLAQEATDLLPMVGRIRLDLPVLAFTAAVSIAAAVGFSLVPAIASVRTELTGPLKTGGAGRGARGSRTTQSWIVGGEVALALILVVGAGLSLRTMRQLNAVDLGFQTDGAVVATFDLTASRYSGSGARAALAEPLVEWARAQPGVRAVGLGDKLPMTSGLNTGNITSDVSGVPLLDLPRSALTNATAFEVGPGLFEAMQLRLQRGRAFERHDYSESHVVIIDQTTSKRLFADEDPIGRELRGDWGPRVVIGVVATIRTTGLTGIDMPVVLRPVDAPWNRTGAGMVVRTEGRSTALAEALRSKALALDPTLPAFTVGAYDTRVSDSAANELLLFQLLGLFAVIAVGMAAVGIYGVTSYAVAQRTHEIGVRMVLGASPTQLSVMLVLEGLRPVMFGVIVGAFGAAFATRYLESMLFGVDAMDAPSFAAAVVGIFAVAALASFVPARRALRVPPISALRRE